MERERANDDGGGIVGRRRMEGKREREEEKAEEADLCLIFGAGRRTRVAVFLVVVVVGVGISVVLKLELDLGVLLLLVLLVLLLLDLGQDGGRSSSYVRSCQCSHRAGQRLAQMLLLDKVLPGALDIDTETYEDLSQNRSVS